MATATVTDPTSAVATTAEVDASTGVADLDLAGALPALVAIGPLGVRCLVRMAGDPIGYVDIEGWVRIGPEELADQIWGSLADEIRVHVRRMTDLEVGELTAAGLSLPAAPAPSVVAPTVTVVIATKDRPETLDRCIDSLLAARPAPAEVIVVDNAPSDDRTRRLVAARAAAGDPLRYVLEPVPGLGRAHNAALPFVATAHVAFTDDDVLVDRGWVGAIAAAFEATPDVACVTGLIAPAELRTREQWWVERASGFAKGFERRVRSLRQTDGESRLFPFDAGTLGSGANMAFTTAFLQAEGGFDPDLGTGTRALGGDDLAALHRVVATGHDLVYEPSAIVFHRHRPDRAGLTRQATGYGSGLTAYLTATVIREPRSLGQLVRRAAPGVRQVFGGTSPLNDRRPADYPQELVWRERAGMATGPFRYLWQLAKGRAA